jgi:translation initiation factor 2 subunit 2
MNYEDMLKKARGEMPESVFIKERFEIPKVMGHIQGNKTIISNIRDIASIFERPINHIVKYILKELATPGGIKNNSFIIGSKIPASRINEKLRQYANEYVLCNNCGKPDTKIIQNTNSSILKCKACGAENTVKL